MGEPRSGPIGSATAGRDQPRPATAPEAMTRTDTGGQLMPFTCPNEFLRCRVFGAALASAAMALPVHAQDPYERVDEAWISIGGSVSSVSEDRFTLDYGDGAIYVEMDDGDRDADAYRLLPGDRVNVMGKIDDDMFESTSIEAAAVYVEKLGTTFYTDPYDEEDVVVGILVPVAPAATTVTGTVLRIGNNELTISTGAGPLTLDVGALADDPLDDEGYPQIRVGDRVRAIGQMDARFFAEPELSVEVLTLMNKRRRAG
jgi:uncharacterized protein YdeI (BOF family)